MNIMYKQGHFRHNITGIYALYKQHTHKKILKTEQKQTLYLLTPHTQSSVQ